MLCYPFYRLQIKKHHALAKHLFPLRTSPWLFSIDMTVDCKTVSDPHGKCILKACACVFYVRVQHSPVRYKAVMCLRSTPYHQILQQSSFTDFFAISTKLILLLRLTKKNNCFDLFFFYYVELQWTRNALSILLTP